MGIELPDGRMFSQTDAVVRWAGKKAGFYPSDADAALIVDELCTTIFETYGKTPAADQKLREEFAAGPLSALFKHCETRIAAAGPFVTGESLTTADLTIYFICEMICTDQFTHVPATVLNAFPKVKALHEKVKG